MSPWTASRPPRRKQPNLTRLARSRSGGWLFPERRHRSHPARQPVPTTPHVRSCRRTYRTSVATGPHVRSCRPGGRDRHAGVASTPASLRCCAVIGAGAPVSGSKPPPDFGNAMTSRMDSGPASSAHDAVPAERDAAVRRGAERERVEQEAELLLRLLLVEAHDREDPFLDVAAVDTDRAAADLVAVADDVVGVGERRARVGVEGVHELRLGRGERVVHGGPRAGADGDVAGATASRPARTAARRRPRGTPRRPGR